MLGVWIPGNEVLPRYTVYRVIELAFSAQVKPMKNMRGMSAIRPSSTCFSLKGHLLPKALVKSCLSCLQLPSTFLGSFNVWRALRAPCFYSGILLGHFTSGVSAGIHVLPCSAAEPFGLNLRSDKSPSCSFLSCTGSHRASGGSH